MVDFCAVWKWDEKFKIISYNLSIDAKMLFQPRDKYILK